MNLQPFTVVAGAAPYLPQANLDTDVIIRIERLTALARDALGPFALESLRYRPDGSEDPGFVMNQPHFRSAPFLLAGENFGCGSSREGAVWALRGIGIRCVVAPSFGDIFFSNCFQNGVLPIQLPREDVLAIANELEGATRPGANSEPRLAINLHERTVTTPAGRKIEFKVDGIRRESLLKGLNEVELTLTKEKEIAAHQAKARAATPWLYPTG